MEVNFDLESKYILSFGVLSPRKNHELLIRSMGNLSYDNSDWLLVIAGGEANYSGYREKLERAARSNEIKKKVIFTGYLEWQLADKIYSNADIYAHTPKYRIAASGPISTAISHQLPILTSDVPVFREIFNHEKDGYLVTPQEQPVSKGLGKLMSNPSLRESLREGTRELVKDFSWENIAQRTIDEYRSVIDQ